MLKQSSSRTQRSKGFKVKHVLQICLVLVICIWLLNQLKHSYDKNKAYQGGDRKVLEDVQSEQEIPKLGRKDLNPQVRLDIENQGDKDELAEEVEEIKTEETEDEGRGGGDDEIDGHDQERAEEEESEEVLEDLIDVDDREREEQENEEKGNQDVNSINDEAKNVGERNVGEAGEEHFEADDSSSSVAQHTQTNGGLRKINKKERDNREDSASSLVNSDFDSLTKAASNEKPQVKYNSRLMLAERSAFFNGSSNVTDEEQNSFFRAVSGMQNISSSKAS